MVSQRSVQALAEVLLQRVPDPSEQAILAVQLGELWGDREFRATCRGVARVIWEGLGYPPERDMPPLPANGRWVNRGSRHWS